MSSITYLSEFRTRWCARARFINNSVLWRLTLETTRISYYNYILYITHNTYYINIPIYIYCCCGSDSAAVHPPKHTPPHAHTHRLLDFIVPIGIHYYIGKVGYIRRMYVGSTPSGPREWIIYTRRIRRNNIRFIAQYSLKTYIIPVKLRFKRRVQLFTTCIHDMRTNRKNGSSGRTWQRYNIIGIGNISHIHIPNNIIYYNMSDNIIIIIIFIVS